MTIKNNGGIFGRNPTFNAVEVDTLTVDQMTSTGSIATAGVNSSATVQSAGSFSPSSSSWTSGAFKAQGSWGGGLAFVDGSAGYGIFVQDGGGTLIFGQGATSGGISERVRVNSSGIAFPSGNGIDFSATAGTGTSELFDDYEEGAFSSSMTCGTSGTIPGTVNGTYVKVGQMVTCTGEGYVPTAPSSPTGNVQITLPFTSGTTGSGSGKRSAGSIIMNGVASANIADFHILIAENSATAYIQLGDATTRQDDSAQQFQQYTDFRFCVTYFTA